MGHGGLVALVKNIKGAVYSRVHLKIVVSN